MSGVDGIKRETEETGVLWWWVSWESAVVRSRNLLLCLRVAVAGGARWAKMTEWVVFNSTRLVPARCNHVQIDSCCECYDRSLYQKRDCRYRCTRPLPEREMCLTLRSRVLLFFHSTAGSSRGSTSERRNGKEHRAAVGGSRWQHNNTNKN
jgi:hypothetical protein